MKQEIIDIKKFISNLINKTNHLKDLENKLNELVTDEIIRDFTIYRYNKSKFNGFYVYDVKQEDYDHILNYISPIQQVIMPDLVIMASKSQDNYRIIFKGTEKWKNYRWDLEEQETSIY